MKKMILFFSFLFLTLIGIIAQDPQPPEDWIGAVSGFSLFMTTLGGIAALTVFLAAAANKVLNTVGFVKQLVAWLIAVLLAVLGNVLNIGLTAELPWLTTILYGVAAGFVANGIFDIELVRAILKKLKIE